MSKMIQIRNVPDDLHRKLKARAAENGQSLSDYLLREVSEISDRPTLAELSERLGRREPLDFEVSAAGLIRAGRPDA